MLTGAEYMDLINVLNVYKLPVGEWAGANAGRGAPYTRSDNGEVLNPSYSTERITNTAAGTDPWNYPDTDWMAEIISDNAPIMRHNAQISGGSDTMTYLGSVSYLQQEVNFNGAPKGFKQFDMRINIDAKISDHLKLSMGLYSRQEDNRQATRSNVINDLIRQYPWFPAYWPTGEFGPDIENGNNPAIRVTDLPGYTDTSRNYVQSNLGLVFKVPGVEGLQLKADFSYDKFNDDYTNWNQPWTLYTWDGVNKDSSGLTPASRGPQNPDLTEYHGTRTDKTATFNASYEKLFGNHFIKLLGGITREETEFDEFEAFRKEFLSVKLIN